MEKFFTDEINNLEANAQKSINSSAARWLNIAYKFDYISLAQKEKIDSLLQKHREILSFGAAHSIRKCDLNALRDINRIVQVTRFSESLLSVVQ